MADILTDVADNSLALLIRVLTEAHDRAPANDVRASFIYRHARNISDLAGDVFVLESSDHSCGARIIVRTMIESLFKLVAAVKVPGFAAEKLIAEIDDELERIQRWSETQNEDELRSSLSGTISVLEGFAQRLRQEHNVSTRNRWTVYDTARVAELGWQYAQDYFIFSKYVHATTSGVISQEEQNDRGHVLQTSLFVVLAAAGYAAQALETATPQAHIDEAARLLHEVLELMQEGVFKHVN